MSLSIAVWSSEDRREVLALWLRCFGDSARDLDRALVAPGCAVFVAREDGAFAGAAIAGSDGLHGWLHGVAVMPSRRRRGVARALVRHAEAWMTARGCVEVRAQLCGDDPDALAVHRHLGYREEAHPSLGKTIVTQDGQAPAPVRSGEPGCLDVVVTHLEMTHAPTTPAPKPPALKLAVLKAEDISVPFYRFLYAETGRDWVWYERRAMDDASLAALLAETGVEVYVLYVGGQPAGYVEFDLRPLPAEIELRYFGLMKPFIGRGIGPWLLDWAIREAWRRAPQRVYVNTCTLDHPRALALYQRLGFRPFAQEIRTFRDPRPMG
jgi:GNAT superfamily N-acetyltransferase